MNNPDDPRQRLNMIVYPDTEDMRTDPAVGKNCGCFRKPQSSTAYCPTAKMHKMPVVRISVSAGILAHRRNKYAVCKRNIPNRERIKQMNHSVASPLKLLLVRRIA